MIDPGLLVAFTAAVAVLMLVPGPNVALIIATSVSYGPRYGLLTVAGTSSAMVVQLGFTAAGMTELLGSFGNLFEWLRWIGVAYLVYLGIAQWIAPTIDLTGTRPEPRSASAIFLRALLVSLTNPKTLLFYGAFFPQFIRADRAVGTQVAVLSIIFLAVALLVDGGWAILAGRVRGVLASRGRLRNHLSGGLLVGAGAALRPGPRKVAMRFRGRLVVLGRLPITGLRHVLFSFVQVRLFRTGRRLCASSPPAVMPDASL